MHLSPLAALRRDREQNHLPLNLLILAVPYSCYRYTGYTHSILILPPPYRLFHLYTHLSYAIATLAHSHLVILAASNSYSTLS